MGENGRVGKKMSERWWLRILPPYAPMIFTRYR